MKLITKASQIKDCLENVVRGRKKLLYSDNIYCYDIETTSLFKINGEYRSFDFTKDKEYYLDKESVALPYVSQFSINGEVYYFRDFNMIGDILKKISNKDVRKFVYVHNLSFEFHWLINVIKKNNWHIKEYIARGTRKIIMFIIEELNIEFRCSYALTNLSLANAGIQYNCQHKKAVGNLDYNKARSPKTRLTKKELEYIENDVVVMTEFLEVFRKQYKHIFNIPLTQTGEVRYYLKENYLNHYYIKKMQQSIDEPWELLMLMSAFMGGYTHANFLHVNKVLKGMGSVDYSSSYPVRLCVNKYPLGGWFEINIKELMRFSKSCCLIFDVTLKNVVSKKVNHYIPYSKCSNIFGGRFDNGRVIKADTLDIIVTDVDMEIIRQCYDFDIEFKHIYASYKKYLDKEVILAILDLYGKKTSLKNVENMEFSYMKSKQMLNSIFGCACTNIVKQNAFVDIYDIDSIWQQHPMTIEYIQEKIIELKQSYSTLFQFSTGVWCTAYARKSLWDIILACDKDNVYNDTDSAKILNFDKYKSLIKKINDDNYENIKKVCDYYNLDIDLFSPCDKFGVKHTLGELEVEDEYIEFKTLGAKKYCYRDKKGKLNLTVSGLKKDAVELLDNDISNFKNEKVFGYEAGKLSLTYVDDQKTFTFIDIDGNEYTCDNIQHAIIAQPTTYTLSIKEDYRLVLDNLEENIYY